MFCFICGKEVECPDVHTHPAVQKDCSAKKGAIWVHVVDDRWSNVEEVPVTVAGQGSPTLENGFAKFDPVDSGEHTAKMELTGELPKKYDPPKDVEVPASLSNGQILYVPFKLVRRAKLRVKVALHASFLPGKTFDAADVTITPKNIGAQDTKPTAGGGIADFEDRSADDYDVTAVLSAEDQKSHYSPDAPLPLTLRPGDDLTFLYEVRPLARPKVEVVEKKSGKKVEKVKVKLTKDAEHDLGETTGVGIAELSGGNPGLRGGEYQTGLTFDQNVYMLEGAAPTFTFADGSTDALTVELVKLARPKIRVVEKNTGKEVEGIVVSLTATKDGKKTDLDKTRNSGTTEIAQGKPGLAPDKYTIAVAADTYKPVLDSPADVTFVEDDTQTVIVKVTLPKGAVRFLIHRYDGLDMAERVTFTMAKTSDLLTLLKTETTAARERTEQREGNRTVKVKEDWKEVGDLDPDTYEIAISNLQADVLDKQVGGQTWEIGPNKDGKIQIEVEPGKTAEVRFTVHKYKKAKFIGYNVLPGYKSGERCPTCSKLYPTGTNTCSNGPCGGVGLKAKRCFQCHAAYDVGSVDCALCAVLSNYNGRDLYCGVCASAKVAVCPTDPLHGPLVVFHHCATCAGYQTAHASCGHGPLAPNEFCGICNGFRFPVCPLGHGNLTLAHGCNTCLVIQPTVCDMGHGPIGLSHKYRCWKAGCITRSAIFAAWTMPCGTGCKLALQDEQIYLGLPDNQEDLLARCLLVKAAIQTAELNEADKKPEELKIFMGPEFYFRGKDGAYKTEDLHLIMDFLREETKDAKYKDWLFVFGTAIGFLSQAPSIDTQYSLRVAEDESSDTIKVTHGPGGKDKVGVCEKVPAGNATLPAIAQWKLDIGGPQLIQTVTKIDADTYQLKLAATVNVLVDDACTLVEASATEILNYALVQRGGPDGVPGLREAIVYKEKISHIDFLREKTNTWATAGQRNIYLNDSQTLALPTEGADEVLGRKKNPISGEATTSGLGGGSVFVMDGITFGLEVCLDHGEARLKKYYATNPKGMGKTQIHLVPSWGMSITPTSLTGMNNTLIFNVDGPQGSDAAIVTLPSTFARLPTPTSHQVLQPAPENVTFKDASQKPPQDKTVNNLDPKYNLLIPQHQHQVNRAVLGATNYAWVDLYAAQDIPPAETV
jgi:hypothetical protein